MSGFLGQVELSVPLFALVALGYALARWRGWPVEVSAALTRFTFAVAIPALLFRLMADRSAVSSFDARLLLAFFGGCLIVFVLGRLLGWAVFRLDGAEQSLFALGGIFSNNVMLGLPLAAAALGPAALPAVALVLVFNSLILWTLVSVSVEWSRHGSLTLRGFALTTRAVLANPIISAIVVGSLLGLTGLRLPRVVDAPLEMLGMAATPLALVALGMALVEYGVRDRWRVSAAITLVKLVVQPAVVLGLAVLLGLDRLETQVAVLLASLATGANVYLMSRRFEVLQGPVAGAIVMSTAASAITTPLVLTLLGA